MNHRWRYIDAAEAASIPSLVQRDPPRSRSVDPRRTGNDVYAVASGMVRRGEEVHDVAGETIKVVGEHAAGKDWVYEAAGLVVHLPGGYRGSLRDGTLVAVLPENYQELLKHGHDAGTGSPPGARGP